MRMELITFIIISRGLSTIPGMLFQGVVCHMDATNQMAWENRVALDMILVEKGRICVMLGEKCCAFIPNDTAPDGTLLTKAL
jgi:hypothetical protein